MFTCIHGRFASVRPAVFRLCLLAALLGPAPALTGDRSQAPTQDAEPASQQTGAPAQDAGLAGQQTGAPTQDAGPASQQTGTPPQGARPASRPAKAPPLMRAGLYQDDIDLRRYWVSEKLDGVRAYWDGERLASRAGNRFHAPAWFTAGFPPVPLDGELWMGRGTFEALSGAVRRAKPDAAQWRQVRFMVFDLPASPAPFDQRLQTLGRIVPGAGSPYLALVKQFRVADRAALMARLQEVVGQGGEGLMLHRGSARYRSGRTADLLKLKTHEDAEATVIAHLPGKGKFAGMLGALLVETPSGQRFRLGSGFSVQERQRPPPIGATITYKYHGKTRNGIPRFASFLRVRNDEP